MYKLGKYNADDLMCNLVGDNYPILLVMSRFGISLGFGDKSIGTVCRESGVDTETFLAVVNLLVDGDDWCERPTDTVSIESLLVYMHNSHDYFMKYRLPAIRRKLFEAIDYRLNDVAIAVLRFFDEYAAEVRKHMNYEEKRVFPYVRTLLEGRTNETFNIEDFRRKHDSVEAKLGELKNILIKYYPGTGSNELNGVLFDIFTCEEDLAAHNRIENDLFVPAVIGVEEKLGGKQS